MRKWLGCVALAGLAGLAGCGPGGKLGSVSGRVTCQGKPVENASIRFDPVKGATAEAPQSAEGVTDAEGRYTLKTPGAGAGATLGRNKVFVIYADIYKAPPCKAPADLVVDVNAGANTHDIELSSAKK